MFANDIGMYLTHTCIYICTYLTSIDSLIASTIVYLIYVQRTMEDANRLGVACANIATHWQGIL